MPVATATPVATPAAQTTTTTLPVKYADEGENQLFQTQVNVRRRGVYLYVHGLAFFMGYSVVFTMLMLLSLLTYADMIIIGQAQQAAINGVDSAALAASTAVVTTVRASDMPVVQDTVV